MQQSIPEVDVISSDLSTPPPLTLYKVLGLLRDTPPGLALEGEVSLFNLPHDLFSAGVGQTLPLTLEWHLTRQHGVLEHNRNKTHSKHNNTDFGILHVAYMMTLCIHVVSTSY